MEHEKLPKSHQILLSISYGFLPILPLNCVKFVPFFAITTKLTYSVTQQVLHTVGLGQSP